MSVKKNALKRLTCDLKEWNHYNNEIPTISAEPQSENIFIWHVNMTALKGRLSGITIHLELQFPDNYPAQPPKVKLLTPYFRHPNVFGDWICLDMIKGYTAGIPYRGWTSAYSVFSILFQLQSFLFADNVFQDYGGYANASHYQSKQAVEKLKKSSKQFECKDCGHTNDEPVPELSNLLKKELGLFSKKEQKSKNGKKRRKRNKKKEICALKKLEKDRKKDVEKNIKRKKGKRNMWQFIYKDLEDYILSYIDNDVRIMIRLSRVSKHFSKLVDKTKIIEMGKFGCWYHRVTLRDDKNIILGYGISPKFYENGGKLFSDCLSDLRDKRGGQYSPYKQSKNPKLKFKILESCFTTFDLISYNAFNEFKVRNNVWKNKSFTHFIPIFITKNHGERSLKLLETCVAKIWNKDEKQYHPLMAVHLICKIMNTLIVDVMEAMSVKEIDLHYSENVLETFFHFYHLLLSLWHKHGNVLNTIIKRKCRHFIQDKYYRHKDFVPNLGDFMIYFSLMGDEFSWDEICKAILEESFTRGVKWLIQAYPSMKNVNENTRKTRIGRTWEKGLVARRLFMFQYFFMNFGCQLGKYRPKNKFNQFNKHFGCPPQGLALRLQNACKYIKSVDNFRDFFGYLKQRKLNEFALNRWLESALRDSAVNGYHRNVLRYRTQNMRKQRERLEDKKELRFKTKDCKICGGPCDMCNYCVEKNFGR